MKRSFTLKGLTLAFLILFLGSCSVSRKTVYFNDLPATERFEWAATEFKEPKIQSSDVLNIRITTLELETSSSNQESVGYLVDKNGNVTIPLIGDIKVEGLTIFEARDAILEKARGSYRNPFVDVSFRNYKVTVLGEVNRPNTYTMVQEKVSLLDAISMAGDLTIYGKRDNILLVRDMGDKKEFVRLDLNSATIFDSPYFYLKQNDVIYVEPAKGRALTADRAAWQYISTFASIASMIVLMFVRLN